MSNIKKINHVAIVVKDIEKSLEFWETALGLKLHHVEDVPSQASKVAFIPVGESEIELVNLPRKILAWRGTWKNAVKDCITFVLRLMTSKRRCKNSRTLECALLMMRRKCYLAERWLLSILNPPAGCWWSFTRSLLSKIL